MTQDLIRYDVLVQEALRGVVKKVVGEVIRTGLPGQHHFYISFDTQHPGVRLSSRMRQRYPEEMTIVLQHQFWDLAVTDHALEVGLSFGGIPERLLVPFAAIKGFFDPSVQFGLQFEVVREGAEAETAPETAEPPKAAGPVGVARAPAEARTEPAASIAPAEKKPMPAQAPAPSERPEPAPGATVVSLDTFRKKP